MASSYKWHSLERNWLLVICIMAASVKRGVHPYHVGFSLCKEDVQNVSSTETIIGPWSTRPLSNRGLYLLGVVFDKDSMAPIIPSSGIYFFLLKIYLKNASPLSQYGVRLKSSYSDRALSAWASNGNSNGELTLSDNIRLSVGEKVFIKLRVENGNVEVSEQSWFSMQLLGQFSLLPSFLARPVVDERFLPNKNVQIYNWKVYHESMTSFSGAGGVFVPVTTGYYICNLNLVMEDVYGMVNIMFNVDNQDIFHLSKQFQRRETIASFHLNKIFSLQRNMVLRPRFTAKNSSFVISKTTTFSCTLSDHKEKSMEMIIAPSADLKFDTRKWVEVNLWQVSKSTKYFELLEVDGKVFSTSEVSLVLVSLSLTVKSSKNGRVVVAVIPGGVKSQDGVCRSILQLRSNTLETACFTCYIKVKERESSYISVFLESGPQTSLKIQSGELKVVAVEQPSSVLTIPFLGGQCRLSSVVLGLEKGWKIFNIDNKNHNSPFKANSLNWAVDECSFSPKESGIYFISANLQATMNNNSSGASDTFEAKIVVFSSKERHVIDLQYNIRQIRGGYSSLILAGTFFLKSSDKVYITYRCAVCKISNQSGFSAVWLFKLFKVEGFSTKIAKSTPFPVNQLTIIDQWSRYFSNFIRTESFLFQNGTYKAPFDGMFLVTCSITVLNISENSILKLRLNIGGSTKSYTEYFYTASNAKRASSLTTSMPVWLMRGQMISLGLEAEGDGHKEENVMLRSGSTFAVVAIVDAQDNPVPGFTLSLRENLKSSTVMPSRSLLGWTDEKMEGAFFNERPDLFKFNKRQGEISIEKPAVIMLNIIVNTELKRSNELILYVKFEEKDVERVFTSRSLHHADSKSHGPFKISLVLYIRSKKTIRVEVRQLEEKTGIYDILENTVMSAIFLSSIPAKPGLMLGLRSYSVNSDRQATFYRLKMKNTCKGCYQQGITYDESQGHFKIPFAGRYLVSVNFNYLLKSASASSSHCGMYSIEAGDFFVLKNVGSGGHFQIAELFHFKKSERLSFACRLNNKIELVGRNFISITLLQSSIPFTDSIIARREHNGEVQNELKTYVSKSGQFLVAINDLNSTTSNMKLLSKTKGRADLILDEFESQSHEASSNLFTIVQLNATSHLSLQWTGDVRDGDSNRTSLYILDPSGYTITSHVVKDFIMKPSNKTSRRIGNWVQSHKYGNEMEFDYERGLFIAKQPAEYMLLVIVRTVAKKDDKRWLYVAVNDGDEKDSFAIPLCHANDGKSCMTSFVQTFKLQKWQSIGLHIRLANQNDSLTVLKGTRFSIAMLDADVPTYDDPGPRFVSQPWPLYKNTSNIFEWECEAIGSHEISYKWYWINRQKKIQQVSSYGRHGEKLQILGKPEESGYYFCSAETNTTLHNSQIAILDISDTDECNLNSTEVEQLCHENAYCINTIGSYRCVCNTGFRGDGFSHCRDIDECQFNETCHVNATCRNTKGSYACKCNAGFYGNGTNCRDINECNGTNKCHVDSTCINEIGSYRCVCNVGYSGNGESCANINECNNEEYPCHRKASCTDNIGSFDCKCNDGWTGNGTICTDINECLVINCTGNATCHNEPGRYRCICNRGFKGDGFQYCEPLGCTPPAHCIGEYKAAWWSRSPYLANSSNKEPIGLFKDLLTQVIVDCCANCSLLSFDGPYNGSLEVEAKIEGNKTVDFGCPLYGSPDQTLFRGLPFMPVVESPGIAFFIKDKPKERSALIGSLGSTWPILAITFLLACLSGVIIWFLDTVRNPTEFPNSFIEGSWEGFWWAFITMTTVGYGDKAPRSFFARLFGIVWILVGLVIISTFTATITTMLTASSLSDETKLYGTKVGVLHNSEEYRLGVKRNAETKGYGSVAEIVSKIKEGEVQGILLDTYIAGEYQDQLRDLRLQQVIDYTFSYGVVLSRDALGLRKCFSHFLESKQSQIYSTISKVIKPLKTNGQQNFAAQKSANIFDAESVYFKYIVMVGLGTFAVLFMVGLTWECYITKRRRTQYSLANHNEPKESDMTQWRVQWESGKVSHFTSNIFRSDIGDLKQQIKDFADTWINRLEELERKQKQEMSELRNQQNKRNRNRHTDNKFGRIFKYFRGPAKTDTNGLTTKMTTAL